MAQMQERNDKSRTSIHVTGMTCATCSRIVERSLQKIDGVDFAAVNLATETAFVALEKDVPQKTLEEAIVKAGYGFSYEAPEDLDRRRYANARRNLLLSWAVGLPLAILMLLHMAGTHIPGFLVMEVLGGAFVLFVPGRTTFKGAWIALSHAHANMDVLVTFGATAAWGTALLALTGVPVVSFGALGPMILGLHILGRFIESHLRDRAAKDIKSLLDIQAREARLLKENGEEISVPIEAVKEGHILLVKTGERIPADGTIRRGRSALDESIITGESIPLTREEGDTVTGGSLNLTAPLELTVTSVGEDSFLSQMVALIQEAQGAKIPIQGFADRVTNHFVPAVASLALLSGLFWFFGVNRFSGLLEQAGTFLPWVTDVRDPLSLAVFAFITTVVIACPCALGLATPMALITGTGQASKKGLIIRNAEAIQTARDVGVVILDKTGTLTEGSPVVVDHNLSPEVLRTVAAIEKGSSHPLAKAISAKAEPEGSPENIEELTGQGVRATMNGSEYFIGKPREVRGYNDQLEKGRTVVEVRRDGTILGFLAIEDPLRENAFEAMKRLKELGIRPVMATGDNEGTARAMARRAGIEEFFAGVHPGEKLNIVHRYQKEGRKVVMVGDGMNDAAALKGADIGMAIGSGTDLAVDNADVVIVRGGVAPVADAVEISRKTFSIIRQNLFWAFAYNVVALPLAMAALLHPVIAEMAMTFSSISVVLNSMRIGR